MISRIQIIAPEGETIRYIGNGPSWAQWDALLTRVLALEQSGGGGGGSGDSAVRVISATLANGADALAVPIETGEAVAGALAQASSNIRPQYVTYNGPGTLATIQFSGQADANTPFKVTLEKP
jgi:hypothetical protein